MKMTTVKLVTLERLTGMIWWGTYGAVEEMSRLFPVTGSGLRRETSLPVPAVLGLDCVGRTSFFCLLPSPWGRFKSYYSHFDTPWFCTSCYELCISFMDCSSLTFRIVIGSTVVDNGIMYLTCLAKQVYMSLKSSVKCLVLVYIVEDIFPYLGNHMFTHIFIF